MKQDLQLSFLDILGYILPGGAVVYAVMYLCLDMQVEDVMDYMIVIFGGYFVGHLFCVFEWTIFGWVAKIICGKRKEGILNYKEGILNCKEERLTWFARRMMKLRSVAPEICEKIPQIFSRNEVDRYEIWTVHDTCTHMLYRSEGLLRQERRLRAFTILFANMAVALFIILLLHQFGVKAITSDYKCRVSILLMVLALLSFLLHCRYRYYRLKFLYTHGILKMEEEVHN